MTAPDPVKRALQMVLATGVRPGEAMCMRWSDVDRTTNTWKCPAEFVKTKRDDVVPLAPFALSLLAESEAAGVVGDWVFPDPSGEARLARSALGGAVLDNKTVFARHSVALFRPHDLRRTVAPGLRNCRFPS